MNQEQRKYLLEKIEETYNNQVSVIEQSFPKEPLLNNYLIGCFLDGSAKILDQATIKKNVTQYVRSLGSDKFVDQDERYSERYNYGRGRHSNRKTVWEKNNDSDKVSITIDPSLFIKMPETYRKDRLEYDKKMEVLINKITELSQQKDLLILKIQIGSNQILDKLITQVDSLGDLDLFSNRLTLIAEGFGEAAESSKKLIGNKKDK